MTILSKKELENLKQATNSEETEDVDALFRELDKKEREKKDDTEEYDPFAEGDFNSFSPEKE